MPVTRVSTLGAEVQLQYGKALPERSRRDGRVPVLGSSGVVGSHDEALTRGPTVVVGRKGSIGTVWFVNEACWPIDTAYYIDDFGGFEPRYLEALLRHLPLGELNRSTAVPGLNRSEAGSLDVPVPDLADQRRIVAHLDACFARTKRAKTALDEVPALLDRLRQSILAAAISGKLTAKGRARIADGVESPVSSVAGVCSSIVDCPHSTPKWTSEGEVCLRTTNFAVTGLDLDEVRYVSSQTYAERTARLVPAPGDVVYSREGGILGIACVIPDGLRACLGQRMMLLRPDRSKVHPEYLAHVLNAPSTLAVVRELTIGTAAPHLNVGDVRNFAVLLPSLDEQREIVTRVNELVTHMNSISLRTTDASRTTERIESAVLMRAFAAEGM